MVVSGRVPSVLSDALVKFGDIGVCSAPLWQQTTLIEDTMD